jgi:hypothetical protein
LPTGAIDSVRSQASVDGASSGQGRESLILKLALQP